MSLDQHVNVTLVVNNSGLTLQGFGTIARLAYNTPWTDPSRTYSKKSEAIADGFASDSPEVLFLNRVFSQSPRPPSAKILRGTRPPTQRYRLTAASAVASKIYRGDVVGQGFASAPVEYTSDSTPTFAEIHNGLLTQLNAVVGKNYLATFPPIAFADFTFTANATTDQLTATAHGRQTGEGPVQLTNVGGALPTVLTTLTNYWLIRVDANTLQVATTLANALAGTFVNFSDAGTGTHTIQHQAGTVSPTTGVAVTATSAGAWFALSSANTALLGVAQDHADPGIAADLDDAFAADPDWYYLSTTYNSPATLLATAAWVEGVPFKAYVAETVDSASETVAAGGGDVLDALKGFSYIRTVGAYRRKPDQMTSDGWIGGLIPLQVGSWTAAYKTVAGATPDAFVSSQITHLDDKRASYYKREAGRAFMWEGKVGSPSYGFLDVTVSLDFVLDLIQKRAFALFLSLTKLPYTDEGIAMMRGTIVGALDVAASDSHQIIAKGIPGDPNDPQPTVVFPRVRDIDPSVRATRVIPPGEVNFRLQAAAHSVGVTVTVVF